MASTPVRAPMSDATLRRLRAFWNRQETDRLCWGVSIGFFVNEAYPRVMRKIAPGPVKPEDIPLPELLEDFDERSQLQRDIGDFPFTCSPFPGIPWLEAIAGCPIMSSPTSFWAEPCLDDLGSWKQDRRVLENPWTERLLEIMRALVEHAQGRYQVSPTLMRGPADILSAMRGATQFSMDFIDTPELISPALEKCAHIWRTVAQAQLDIIPESSEGYIALEGALRAWAPDRLLWLQEDAMALLSPTLYRNFVLPLDEELSGHFRCVAFHLHGTALWAISDLVQVPGVDVMELNLEAAMCDVEGTLAGWKKIQQHKPLVIWRCYADDFAEWLPKIIREFPAKGLSIQVSVRNVEEARKVQDEFRKNGCA
jgi:hypothetical protein